MSEAGGWPSSAKGARQLPSHKALLFAILVISTMIFGLWPQVRIPKRLQDDKFAVKRGVELGSQGEGGIWKELTLGPWDLQMQNQTRRRGQTIWEPEFIGWHPRRIDLTDFTSVKAIQPGRLEIVRHPDFGTTPVLVKIAQAHEATTYRLLYDLNITPSFLGHVTQSGNIVGFITEFVQTHGNIAAMGPSSRREACLAALRRMHARGIAHRDSHGENCLLREDGSAALIDFELSAETSSRADFDRDLWIMYHTVLD